MIKISRRLDTLNAPGKRIRTPRNDSFDFLKRILRNPG